jgi:WD40 repeat protein
VTSFAVRLYLRIIPELCDLSIFLTAENGRFILPCFCDILPFLSSLFSDKIIFSRIFLRSNLLNSKMQLSFSAPERNAISSYAAQLLQQRFSRRTMLGGLVLLAGAGSAGCASLPGQTSTSVSAAPTLSPTPTPTLSPTPTPAPTLGTMLYTYHDAGRVNAVAWAPDGQRLASGSQEASTVQIWDALTGANMVTHHGYEDSGMTVTWAPDGRRLASGDSKVHFGVDFVEIWDAATGNAIKTYSPHTNSSAPGPVNGLSWSPDGKYLAAANFDYTVRVWDLATDKLRFFYSDPNGYLMTCITWSPDSKYIAFGNDDNGTHDVKVQVWNVASQSRVAICTGHTLPIETVAWSPNGEYLASGSIDKTVRVWHATTASQVLTYTGHDNQQNLSSTVLSVAWSPDSRHIASAGQDTTVQIWEALSGKQVYTYHGHHANVYAALWSPNGQSIASGGDDGTVQVWQAV